MAKKGLTLLEIVVATVIMALVMTGLANIFVGAKRWLLHSRSRMAGGELGKYFLDPLAASVKQSDWDTTQNDYVASNPLHKRSAEEGTAVTLDNRTYTSYYTLTVPPTFSANDPMRKAKVEIKWTEE